MKKLRWERTAAAPSRNSCSVPRGSTEAGFIFGVNEGSRAGKERGDGDLITHTVCVWGEGGTRAQDVGGTCSLDV